VLIGAWEALEQSLNNQGDRLGVCNWSSTTNLDLEWRKDLRS